MNILLAESNPFSSHALAVLQQVAKVTAANLDREELLQEISQYEILWVRLRNQIDENLIRAGTKGKLKLVVTATTGLNHINLEAAEAHGVKVISLRGEREFLKTVRATAEHTLLLALALLRNFPAAVSHARDGGWNRDLFRGHELLSKTVGIVGYGRLGQITAEYFRAFGCRVLVCDTALPQGTPSGVEAAHLEQVLQASDLISLHVNLSPETETFFDRACFEQIKPGAWLINTARGELIDEVALLDHLRSGHLAGAAVDVLTEENASGMKHHALSEYARQHSNLIITPHIGGCTFESTEKTEVFIAEKTVQWIHAQNREDSNSS